eukprot:447030-Hanusia_phi.AAC.3
MSAPSRSPSPSLPLLTLSVRPARDIRQHLEKLSRDMADRRVMSSHGPQLPWRRAANFSMSTVSMEEAPGRRVVRWRLAGGDKVACQVVRPQRRLVDEPRSLVPAQVRG